ncbi:hypothetical protein L6452_20636 [Arctium lappa]|uniref:Uncharacterized protein n=1 Tax=Arctium lappa TaxID=4217 RepID=A0ACB9BBE7_ARCLA|nr:hypothetical protein L6452_20636 [Arctium lappa]
MCLHSAASSSTLLLYSNLLSPGLFSKNVRCSCKSNGGGQCLNRLQVRRRNKKQAEFGGFQDVVDMVKEPATGDVRWSRGGLLSIYSSSFRTKGRADSMSS